jgi:hypothetical protein
MFTPVPPSLVYVRTFRSQRKYVKLGDVFEIDPAYASTLSVEQQIAAWVRESGALIVSVGPVYFYTTTNAEQLVETETLAVMYAADVEQPDASKGHTVSGTEESLGLPRV